MLLGDQEHVEIRPQRAADIGEQEVGPRGIVIPAPILTRDRALLVGIGRNQAGFESKAFIIRQAGRDARLPPIFSYPRESQPAEITELLFRSDT
jgi:hypothetical protein